MHIHDFYNKFTAVNEGCNLFQALRNLSLSEDLKAMLDGDSASLATWVEWPPMPVQGSTAISAAA